jgi:short-subunit dehydrogenase
MAALELMRPCDRGAILSVGSALAFRGIPLQAAYCASKFAVRGFMQMLRTELLHEGSHVRVSMIHLPAVNTPQFGWCRSRLPGRPQPVPRSTSRRSRRV